MSGPDNASTSSRTGAATPRTQTRSIWRSGRFLLGLTLAFFAAGALALYFRGLWLPDFEQEMIRLERARRYAMYETGDTLPGTPNLASLDKRLAAEKVALGAPVLIRIFKREFELELWLAKDGKFTRFATYPICRWSGALGPKLKQGDAQAPEGFYTVDQSALNPNSKYHLSFNLGYPNAFDQAHGRTGSLIMVHGNCVSIGCFAMTDPVIDEIWKIVTAALAGGQSRFQVEVFPFRMTEANLDWRADDERAPFWRDLKKGYDLFEQTQVPPKVSVCNGRYAFEPGVGDGSAPITAACPQSKPAS